MTAITGGEPARRPRRRLQRGSFWTALALLAVLSAGALLAPLVLPDGRDTMHFELKRQAPSWQHPFGTDVLGRDTLARVLYGGRISLLVALLSTLIAVTVGTGLGLWAGYRGGRTDTCVSALVNTALALPAFFVLLLLGSWFGGRIASLCIVIGLTNWMPVARLVRTAAWSLRERPFVDAARALGYSTPRILLRHVLPSASAPIGVAAVLAAAQALGIEAALGYLGFGLQPPTPSWGGLLHDAQGHVFDAPWMAVFPGLVLFLVILSFHRVADEVRDALDPRLGV